MKKSIWMVVAVIFSIIVLSVTAFATPILTYHESGDAGESIADAILLPDGTHTVFGDVGLGEVDMYGFNWAGGAFYLNSMGTSFDSLLFLFNEQGNGIQASDDDAGHLWSYLQLPNLDAGRYYFAMTGFLNVPLDSANISIFDFDPISGELLPEPSNPQAILTSWLGADGSVDSGRYRVNFAPTNAVPEPASFILIGAGLAGLAVFRKKFRA